LLLFQEESEAILGPSGSPKPQEAVSCAEKMRQSGVEQGAEGDSE